MEQNQTGQTVAAAEEFLVSMTPRLMSYLHVVTGNLHDAQDILQDVFARYVDKGPPADTRQAESWLFAVSRNRARNLIRNRTRRRQREEAYVGGGEETPRVNPADTIMKAEALKRIEHCLLRLSLELREILFLRVVENVPFRELAERFGIAKSTAAARASEALVQLSACFHEGEA